VASLPAAVDGPGGVKAAVAGDGEPKAEGRRRGGRRSHKEGKEAKDRLAQEPESASEPAFAMPSPVPADETADETAAEVVAEADPAKSRRGGGRPRRAEAEPDSPVGDAVAAVLAEPGAPEVAKEPTAKRIARAPRSRKPKAVSE
jgi:hypothetical protein